MWDLKFEEYHGYIGIFPTPKETESEWYSASCPYLDLQLEQEVGGKKNLEKRDVSVKKPRASMKRKADVMVDETRGPDVKGLDAVESQGSDDLISKLYSKFEKGFETLMESNNKKLLTVLENEVCFL